jgi:hypothetical protein
VEFPVFFLFLTLFPPPLLFLLPSPPACLPRLELFSPVIVEIRWGGSCGWHVTGSGGRPFWTPWWAFWFCDQTNLWQFLRKNSDPPSCLDCLNRACWTTELSGLSESCLLSQLVVWIVWIGLAEPPSCLDCLNRACWTTELSGLSESCLLSHLVVWIVWIGLAEPPSCLDCLNRACWTT